MEVTDKIRSIFDRDTSSQQDDGSPGAVRGEYTWNDYLEEYASTTNDGQTPSVEDLPGKYHYDSLTPDGIEDELSAISSVSHAMADAANEHVVATAEGFDEDQFFTTSFGEPTIVSRYDLEKAVSNESKTHFVEIDRYWVNKPFAFIIMFRSKKENEVKYFAIEPQLNKEEEKILEFIKDKLQDTIKFSDEAKRGDRTNAERAALIEQEAYKLLLRYDLIDSIPFVEEGEEDGSVLSKIPGIGGGDAEEGEEGEEGSEDENENTSQDESGGGGLRNRFFGGGDKGNDSIVDKLVSIEEEETREEVKPVHVYTQPEELPDVEGSSARPEDAVINDNRKKLTEHQVMKLLYYAKRDSVSYGPIDPIKHDINVEDISCDGYNERVFAYHGDHEQIITNIWHGKKSLDNFVINLAQRSGKGISKRQPQVDATLPDGSRSQLTLGAEVSDHGTNYTIRQFNEIPNTPVDLINWQTFDPDQMAFLWLAIENHKSLIFAGGTASGKTTSLNAVSLFIPSGAKIVSIEDTREVELPQRNWVASVTRPSFTKDGAGEVDEFALLEAALRQRPEYIVMGEIRGEEGRTLFQVMSTGHTTYTTFHADSVGEVIKRFTTEPINVSKTLFTALDLVSIQTQTRVNGNKVRRNKVLSEINDYSAETGEINVNDIYQWIAETDTYERTEESEVINQIQFDRGWSEEEVNRELRKRQTVLAYLIKRRLNTYTQVAATVQAFINDHDVILDLIANDELEDRLEYLREMESVDIDIDPDKEAMVPRPEPPEKILDWANGVLERESDGVLADRMGGAEKGALVEALETTKESEVEDVTTMEEVESVDIEEDDETDDDEDTSMDMGGFTVGFGDEEPPDIIEEEEQSDEQSEQTAFNGPEGFIAQDNVESDSSDDTGGTDGQ